MNFDDLKINKTWTLFLDRDGVINKRIINGYVRSWKDFEFLPGVLPALATLSEIFGKVIIVSNQQGIGKGLMNEQDVIGIHRKMISEIKAAGGKIDQVYFCPDLEEDHSVNRKPEIGMALQAQKEFPVIDFRRSIMVGDSQSDMLFGKKLNMVKVFLTEDPQAAKPFENIIDFIFKDLKAFSTVFNTLQ